MKYNPYSLNGKNILITGASSGIGKATAIECSKMGATLFITGRNEKRLLETYDSLQGENHKYFIADISSKEGISSLLNKLTALDGIVLAAGFVEMWPTMFATDERIEKIFRTNLYSPIEIIRSVIKMKLFKKGMSVVAIDSIAGTYDFSSGNCIYGAGKAALSSFLKYFVIEHSSKNIRINTISPGLILTPMHTDGVVDDEQLDKMVQKVPLKRWGLPEDIAYAAIYLLSDAASYLTGSDIKIDGGVSL